MVLNMNPILVYVCKLIPGMLKSTIIRLSRLFWGREGGGGAALNLSVKLLYICSLKGMDLNGPTMVLDEN